MNITKNKLKSGCFGGNDSSDLTTLLSVARQNSLGEGEGVSSLSPDYYFGEGIKSFVPYLSSLSSVRASFGGFLVEGDLPVLVGFYKSWLARDCYLSFYSSELDRYLFMRGAKRGNDVYRWKVKESLKSRLGFLDDRRCGKLAVRRFGGGRVSNVLFITLTFNPSLTLGRLDRAWKGVSYEYNKFITRFRRKFGRCWVIRATQSFYNGFPHVHLVAITEKSWRVRFHKGMDDDNRYVLRDVDELKKIQGMWHSHVDVRGVTYSKKKDNVGFRGIRNYIFKDLLKCVFRDKDRDVKDWNTLSLSWLFRKQSFSVSGEGMLGDILGGFGIDLISEMSNSNSYSVDFGFVFVGLCCVVFCEGVPPPFLCEVEGGVARKLGVGLVLENGREEC